LLSRSRKTTIRSFRDPRTERSRRASISGPRVSEDSCCPEIQLPLDPGVSERALQRRRILEELISTEESYIGDVRFLMNVCMGVRGMETGLTVCRYMSRSWPLCPVHRLGYGPL
jgi:hypothetical protein